MAVIVKSMSRKTPDFAQLFDYMTRDKTASANFLHHNLYGKSRTDILREFQQNAAFLPKRKNGNLIYHEIIALPELSNIPFEQQEQGLIDLARYYLQARAPDQMAFGVVHYDKKHLHLHLMISSNKIRSKKRAWIAKKHFSSLQRELEAYQINAHPHLGKDSHYQRTDRQLKQEIKLKEQEFQQKARTGKNLKKEELKTSLELVFVSATSKTHLLEQLKAQEFELYQSRGAWGIIDQNTGKKYRLKTLDLLILFENALERFALINSRTKDLLRIREAQKKKQQEKERKDDFDRDDF